MRTEAIAKLKLEMDGNLNNPYIQVIGGYLLQYLDMNPVAAEKLLAADKTISKSLEAMKTEAQKKQHGGMALLTDVEGYAIVLKYFDIDGAPVVAAVPVAPIVKTPAAADFDINLDDLLGV